MKDPHSWEESWQRGVTPWDLGGPTPAFIEELESRSGATGGNNNNNRGIGPRALIPGCGAGYDVVALAQWYAKNHQVDGGKVIGLDMSKTSIERAYQVLNSNSMKKTDNIQNFMDLVHGDFFESDYDELFDFVYDYTFFCALPPSLRLKWGHRMAEMLGLGGELLTFVFPITDDEEESASDLNAEGPPYPVSLKEYRKALEPVGFQMISQRESMKTVKPRKGRELIVRWVRC